MFYSSHLFCLMWASSFDDLLMVFVGCMINKGVLSVKNCSFRINSRTWPSSMELQPTKSRRMRATRFWIYLPHLNCMNGMFGINYILNMPLFSIFLLFSLCYALYIYILKISFFSVCCIFWAVPIRVDSMQQCWSWSWRLQCDNILMERICFIS